MGEGVSTDNNMEGSQSDSIMDLDFMDELMSEGFWLQKTEASESLEQSPFSSCILFDSSLAWPALEEPAPEDDPSKGTADDTQKVLPLENSNYIIDGNSNKASCSLIQSRDCSAEAFDLNRSWWIGPTTISMSSMERLIRALRYIRDCLSDRDVLIQVWLPVHKDSKRVLTTNHQPFTLNRNSAQLAGYREASVNYKFTAEEGAEEFRGLPGRVFTSKVPEWTPDVQLFRKDEYQRISDAQHHDVRGTFGVPVFELDDHNCLGVIEVVFVTQKIKYRMELESVCKALEAVDLRCSSSSTIQSFKTYDYSYQTALPEVKKILRVVCDNHSLPLAQAWASCTRQHKEGSRHTNQNLIYCVSTVDTACFVRDPRVQGFHEACSEHHLLKGQGIVGRAFMTNQPCFLPDITSCTKTEYPLSHYARMFGLHAAVAIPMKNVCVDSTDFVLELFLPMESKDPEEHGKMITSFYAVIQKLSQTLCAVTYRELQKEHTVTAVSNVGENALITEGLFDSSPEEVTRDVGETSKGENRELKKACARKSPETRPSNLIASGGCGSPNVGKTGEKRRSKAEKVVNLEILQQYFAGSLKDAAKSIGVCPTTLKRICRQHGIKRWPSRKIKKVGHTLRKIQRVIDSVQGPSGTLPVDSFYNNFPDLFFLNSSQQLHHKFPTSNSTDPALQQPLEHPVNLITAVAAVSKSSTSSSSCSQNSTPSQPALTGTEQQQPPLNVVDSGQDLLKRIDSTLSWQLMSSNEGLKLQHPEPNNVPLVRSANAYRLKVTYGEEKVRFRMQSHWSYKDLMREIMKRFGIVDTSKFVIKYLDDDLEWVLLSCDDDLEECIDVHQSSGNQIIRLSIVSDTQ